MGKKKKKGFTYTEVIFSLPVIMLSILTAMAGLMGARAFNERANVYSNAMNLALNRIEEIRYANMSTADLSDIQHRFNGPDGEDARLPHSSITQEDINTMWDLGLNPLEAEAVSYIDLNASKDQATVTVVACYRDARDRVSGSDKNFNGIVDNGEVGDNGKIVSPITLRTIIVER